MKHSVLATKQPKIALELSMMYVEGFIFSVLLFVLPFISLKYFFSFLLAYFTLAILFAIFAAWKEKRPGLLLVPFPYAIVMVINSYIFLEQMVKEVILRRKNLVWFKPQRFNSNHSNS